MIKLDKQGLGSKWFLLWDTYWGEFTDGRTVVKQTAGEDRTNLCTYFWMSIGAPLFIIVSHLGVLAFAFWVVFIFSINRLTATGLAIEVTTILVAIVLFWAIREAIELYSARQSSRPYKPWKPSRIAQALNSFFDLLGQYIRAFKDRVCPLIALEDKKEKEEKNE